MKRLPLTSALLALTVTITACTDPVPTPATADLTLSLKNVASARVKVTNAAGEIKFDDSVIGSKTLSALPTGKYTVTGSNTATFAAPAPQTLELTANTTATLNYTALKGSLTLKVVGVPSARVVVKDAAGKEVFAETVTGSKTLADLTYGDYTVTPEKVDGQITPTAQTVTVGGNVSATLTYSTTALPKATLTLTVTGVPSATVQVKQGGVVLFDGLVTGSKTLTDLPRESLTVSGSSVGGFLTPLIQTVDLGSGSGSVALGYIAAAAPFDPARLQGTILGWDGGTGVVTGGGNIPASGNIDLALPLPDLQNWVFRKTLLGCTFISSNGSAQFLEIGYFDISSSTGGSLGSLIESASPTLPMPTTTSYSVYERVYSTAATTLSGSGVACGNNQTKTANLTLQAGWNLVVVSLTPSGIQVSNRTGQPYYLLFQAEPKALDVSIPPGPPLSVQLPKKTLDLDLSVFPRGRIEGDYALTLEGVPAGTTLSESSLKVAGASSKALTLTLPDNVPPGKIDATLVITGPVGTVKTPFSFTVQAPAPTAILTLDTSSVTVTPGSSTTFKGKVKSSNGTLGYLSLGLRGESTNDLNFSPYSLSNVTEAGQDVTFTLSAGSAAVSGDRSLAISLTGFNGTSFTPVPLTVKVLSSGFSLRLDSTSLSVYPGESLNVPVTLSSINSYSGPVNLNISGLPQGVTVQPKTVNLTGSSVSTNLVLSAAPSAVISRSTFTVTAENGAATSSQAGDLLVFPASVKVPGTSPISDLTSNSVDAQSNLWINADGFTKVTSALAITTTPVSYLGCAPVVGLDGGIWSGSGAFKRLDPATGSLSDLSVPPTYNNCRSQIDAKGRAWTSDSNLNRIDFAAQSVDKVPGPGSYGDLHLEGASLWSFSSGSLARVDTDTLATTTYVVPGGLSSNFVPVNGKLYFVSDSKLATFDPLDSTVSRADSGAWRIYNLFGTDASANAWVRAYDAASGRAALLRLSPAGTVLRELPDIPGSFAAAPNGGLWYANTTYYDPRVGYIAP
jgi:streptogramin lyase